MKVPLTVPVYSPTLTEVTAGTFGNSHPVSFILLNYMFNFVCFCPSHIDGILFVCIVPWLVFFFPFICLRLICAGEYNWVRQAHAGMQPHCVSKSQFSSPSHWWVYELLRGFCFYEWCYCRHLLLFPRMSARVFLRFTLNSWFWLAIKYSPIQFYSVTPTCFPKWYQIISPSNGTWKFMGP